MFAGIRHELCMSDLQTTIEAIGAGKQPTMHTLALDGAQEEPSKASLSKEQGEIRFRCGPSQASWLLYTSRIGMLNAGRSRLYSRARFWHGTVDVTAL